MYLTEHNVTTMNSTMSACADNQRINPPNEADEHGDGTHKEPRDQRGTRESEVAWWERAGGRDDEPGGKPSEAEPRASAERCIGLLPGVCITLRVDDDCHRKAEQEDRYRAPSGHEHVLGFTERRPGYADAGSKSGAGNREGRTDVAG